MTHNDYTKNILNIKDENIYFDENCFEEMKIDNIDTKVFHGKLTYTPTHCENCEVTCNSSDDIIKCIKRIAFGYKSFSHFKTRIMLITGIYKIV